MTRSEQPAADPIPPMRLPDPHAEPVSPSGNDESVPLHQRTLIMPAGNTARADTVARRSHLLVVLEGSANQRGRRIPLGAQPLTIGRLEPCELALDDPQASRAHCRVELDGQRAVVTDLNSTNGTFLEGERISGRAVLRSGAVLQIGRHKLRYECITDREFAEAEAAERDLVRASQYVQSLLPTPLSTGDIRTHWRFEPSTRVGGDCFGHHALDERYFAMYLVDVAGHGTGAALHAVSVMNVLRHRALPGVDMRRPTSVLRHLNDMFQMDHHGGMFFTLWYGVYDVQRRALSFASAGHHPAYLVTVERREATPLYTRNVPIGAFPDIRFKAESVPVGAGSTLYLFSDGVFEITTSSGDQAGLADLLPLLVEPAQPGIDEPSRIYQVIRGRARDGLFEDDFSLLTVTFL
jgi:serine phosphatase RsbU (regulator of sigma subunit)